jgi:hypothetical protein
MVGFTAMPLSCCDLQKGTNVPFFQKDANLQGVEWREARWGAACPDTFLPVLMIRVKLRITRKSGHFLPKVCPHKKNLVSQLRKPVHVAWQRQG